jgi:hypothetical protein
MAEVATGTPAPTAEELKQMRAVYLQGGLHRLMAPHIVYAEPACPHAGCGQQMHAIGFCLEDRGRAIHDSLVRAWWSDVGFAGRCPHCGGWIHFTISGKTAITAEEAAGYPQLPDDWYSKATIL